MLWALSGMVFRLWRPKKEGRNGIPNARYRGLAGVLGL